MAATVDCVLLMNEEATVLAQLKAEEVARRREQRSMSKAERVLGVSDRGDWRLRNAALEERKRMKRGDVNLNFSFPNLRGAFKGRLKESNLRRELNTNAVFGRNPADADSMSSSPSPTFDPPAAFDPAASTSTLPSTLSSPASPHHRKLATVPYRGDKNVSARGLVPASANANHGNTQAAVIVESGFDVAKIRQQTELQLPPLDLPSLTSTAQGTKSGFKSYLVRNKSTVSVASTETDMKPKLSWRVRKDFGTNQYQTQDEQATRREPLKSPVEDPAGPSNNRELRIKTGKNIRDWLENADLDRSPSLSGRRLGFPHHHILNSPPFSSTSSCNSIRTLTSQAEDDTIFPTEDSTSSQWPLPAKKFDLNGESKRMETRHHNVSKSDLQLESMLSLSSDEEGDIMIAQKRKTRQSQGSANSESTVRNIAVHTSHHPQTTTPTATRNTHKRIHDRPILNSRNIDPTAAYPFFPNQTLLSDATTLRGSRRPSFSAAEWQQNDETELSVKTLAALESQSFLISNESGRANHLTNVHSPTRAIGSVHATSSARPSELETTPQKYIATANFDCKVLPQNADNNETENVGNDDLLDEELDVSKFPIPPHAYLNSAVPKIQVEFMDDSKRLQTGLSNSKYRGSTMLSTSSATSSASSRLYSQISDQADTDSLDDFLNDYIQQSQDETTFHGLSLSKSIKYGVLPCESALQRTRTISNVPIYVTQFDNSCDSSEAGGDDGVATFVFSSS